MADSKEKYNHDLGSESVNVNFRVLEKSISSWKSLPVKTSCPAKMSMKPLNVYKFVNNTIFIVSNVFIIYFRCICCS